MIVIMGTTTLVPMLQIQQANAASLRQHSNLLNNCYRPDLCGQSNVHQGTAGNDNQVTGFGDLSNNGNTPTVNSSTAGAQEPAGPKGDPGTPGAPGAQGPPGPDKVLSLRVVRPERTTVLPGITGPPSTALCDSNEFRVGGGFSIVPTDSTSRWQVVESQPSFSGNGWLAEAQNLGSNNIMIQASAICLTLVPPP